MTKKIRIWNKEHPDEVAKRIDKIQGEELYGLKEYYATKSGKIISCKGREAKELQYVRRNRGEGYASVDLCIDGHRKKCAVHRLVMETFKRDINFFPQMSMMKKRLGITIIDYDAHHINPQLDEKGFLNNSVDNIMGIWKPIHYQVLNYFSVTENSSKIKYNRAELADLLQMLFVSHISTRYAPGECTVTLTGAGIVNGKKIGRGLDQRIITGSDLEVKENLTNQATEHLEGFSVLACHPDGKGGIFDVLREMGDYVDKTMDEWEAKCLRIG
ncbi:MAG: hypothetical protein LUF34_05815 [Lachnospiraceae bacterium]|nr:hypothetical protein [Lachnospiraceae bacterium]